MPQNDLSRRAFLAGVASAAAVTTSATPIGSAVAADSEMQERGSQRLSLEQLRKWESLQYGMFIHFGMSTFDGDELSMGQAPASLYAPDRLDVDQWVSVARDAGMRYAVLTTKHVAGHCLWPSPYTDYTVANSTNKTNVVEAFCKACERRGVLPGFYYCSWDNHNRFGSKTPSEGCTWNGWEQTPKSQDNLPPFTTSLYQTFQTYQITELLTQFGPIAEIWIDIPGVLGRGYREFLYNHIAGLQPNIVIMMNNGICDGSQYDVSYAWPADVIALERNKPPQGGHKKWRDIEGKRYYMPGETCDIMTGAWFWVEGQQHPRSDEELITEYQACRNGGVNFLLDVPPDKHGVIPEESVASLLRLRKNAGI